MPSVFVLMPFEEEFDSIYEDLIKQAFEEANFEVIRADDIESQRSILSDIVQQIAQCDLIVADLTGSNPNVFYELGIAHGLERKAILMTQNRDEIPFDLTPYRVLEYSTHFKRIEDAKKELASYARGFVENRIQFGNPVSDWLPGEGGIANTSDLSLSPSIEVDDRGLLDHVLTVNEGYGKIAKILDKITDSMEKDVRQPTNVATLAFQKLNAYGSKPDPRAAQKVAQRLARNIFAFNSTLTQANTEYSEIADEIDPSLEFVVSFAKSRGNPSDPSLNENFDSMIRFRTSALYARDACDGLVEIIDGVPRMERRLNRALAKQSEELRVFSSNIDKSIASVTRAINIWENRRTDDGLESI